MLSKNLNFDVTNLMWIAFVGIIIKLFLGSNTSDDGKTGPANAAVWGYGVVTLAVLGIAVVSYAMSVSMETNDSLNTFGFIKLALFHSIPSVLMLGILVWLITINAMHFEQINKGKTAEEYDTYSSVSTWLVIAQLGVLIKLLMEELNVSTTGLNNSMVMKALQGKMASVSFLLTITNVFVLIIMTIILTYFSTDG